MMKKIMSVICCICRQIVPVVSHIHVVPAKISGQRKRAGENQAADPGRSKDQEKQRRINARFQPDPVMKRPGKEKDQTHTRRQKNQRRRADQGGNGPGNGGKNDLLPTAV